MPDDPILEIDESLTNDEEAAPTKHVDDSNKVSWIMIGTMSSDLQKAFENTWAYKMNLQLDERFH